MSREESDRRRDELEKAKAAIVEQEYQIVGLKG